jgi:hypothetical protein
MPFAPVERVWRSLTSEVSGVTRLAAVELVDWPLPR